MKNIKNNQRGGSAMKTTLQNDSAEQITRFLMFKDS